MNGSPGLMNIPLQAACFFDVHVNVLPIIMTQRVEKDKAAQHNTNLKAAIFQHVQIERVASDGTLTHTNIYMYICSQCMLG